MFRRWKPAEQPAAGVNPAQALLAWSARFDAGELTDPALTDGALAPGERFAVRIGPVVAADLAVTPQVEVSSPGPEGTLVATDRRALVVAGDGSRREWAWDRDVDGVTALAGGFGCMFMPSAARFEAGVKLQGVVLPGYVRGKRPGPADAAAHLMEFKRVEVAWRASRPGGVAAWAEEFQERYRHLLG